jgi:hypothetical protein
VNNFVFSQDPVLFQSTIPMQTSFNDGAEMKKQFDATMAQYQAMQQHMPQITQQKNTQIDYLGELDSLTKNINSDVAETLSVNTEYLRINNELQLMIQEEMIRNVKWSINNNPEAINKMTSLRDIILTTKKEKNEENSRNMMELNDYIKNYSDLTFDEYKKLKGGRQ